ncbi:ubiquinone biosynthesis accessory factor UbiJ [Neisseria blantyrii]|uniref:ubiquinone biosynthesis accessory factor UbiJ n=1 Tax=Neisseria blantyrii TaxID=2830647 RepID=UPI002659F3EF|nr:SCP2 domain-containing protein [Neisseria blantyrii]
MSALLPIINRLILQSSDSRSELAAFAGKTLTLNIAGLKLAGRITEDGLLAAGNGFADTEIIFRNSAIQKILQGGEPGVGDIGLEGDLILGIAVLSLLGSLRSRASDELARIFGTQSDIGSRAADIGHGIKQIGRNIAEQIGGFSREPESANIGNEALADCLDEISRLRDDVARLNERLDRLERDIWID